jgi:hypothetical protein
MILTVVAPYPLIPSPLAATVYTQVIESLPVLELPHPNPPLVKGRGQESLVSPLSKGGLRGVKPGSQSNSDLCVHGSRLRGGETKQSFDGVGFCGFSK